MSQTNPYKAYVDDTILNESPVGLIVALYVGAIEASVTARRCLASGDIPARTKAINKIINIVTELTRSLNDEKGGDVSVNLRRLYVYIQGRVLQAHMKKQAAPLEEVEKLLSTMLEGWKVANVKLDPTAAINAASHALAVQTVPGSQHDYGDTDATYGSYLREGADTHAASAYSF